MRHPKLLALAVLATSTAGLGVLAPAAHAGDLTGSTDVTFSVAGAGIALATAATSAALGEVTSTPLGATASGGLPKVTVTDNRAGTTGWSAQVSSAGFAMTTDATKTIAASKAKVFVPAGNGPTVVSGTVVASAGTYLTAGTGLALSSTAATLVSTTSLTGSNKVEFTPNIAVTIDSTVLVGNYAGVVTQTLL